ncbi:MAG: EscU/YscU/HrcU family type III secretion system export apparatus switch protein [Rhodospirillaceae bacterium]|nr:EscU/YscU/HrcU family type III secretion system export apparatus switch protein [Rhodospirillaceae bacterium]
MTDKAAPPPGQIPKTIAVAVEEQDGAAPKVGATGRGYAAEQILALAFARGIKVREDADLAQILAAVDVDSEIPTEAFAAVAEILAHVYRANGETPRGFAAQHEPGGGFAADHEKSGDAANGKVD